MLLNLNHVSNPTDRLPTQSERPLAQANSSSASGRNGAPMRLPITVCTTTAHELYRKHSASVDMKRA
jgi:hypothetical protein